MTGIRKALDLFDGSPTKLAAAIGGSVRRQHIDFWLKQGQVPAAHCMSVENATGGKVTRKELRPKDWQAIWPELEKQPRSATNHPGERATDRKPTSKPNSKEVA